ncbi:MAG TPA: S24 family peptidase [Candidatus Babeliales bacterium]|nr:S24 family peptidase [Candidatus Babeliales bacterium]
MTSTEKHKLTTPSERLKYIRALLRVTRAYLQTKYGLPEITLKSWENGTTKLTRTGAKRCVEIYLNEGIIVSEDWIMEGAGLDPTASLKVSQYFATPTDKELPTEDDEVCMFRDANIFKESHPGIVIMIVSNDDMRPFYKPGDYIGGKMRFGNDIHTAINKDCIVHLKNGERFFRRLIKNHANGYNLTCLNPNETTAEPVLYDVEIEGVAPIIWHRWKDD